MEEDFPEYEDYQRHQRPTLVDDKSHQNHWRNRANDLHASAGAIWLSMSNGRGRDAAMELGLGDGFDMHLACTHVYHMLCGLSLEVAMKAALVSQGITPPEKHDLNLLAHLLGVKRNPAQRKILNFYQHSVVWAGRYPVPVNATDEKLIDYYEMANTVLYKGKTVIKGTTINIKTYSPTGATSWERYDALYKSYTALFDHRYPGATHGRA